MDGDWNTIKAKPKKKKTQNNDGQKQVFGGKGTGGKLVAGPVRNAAAAANVGKQSNDWSSMNNQASNIAEYDFGLDNDYQEEEHYELVSHTCAQSVSEARNKAGLTQNQLAQKCGTKNSVIVDIENATARYDANVINAIDKALNCKITRARKKK